MWTVHGSALCYRIQDKVFNFIISLLRISNKSNRRIKEKLSVQIFLFFLRLSQYLLYKQVTRFSWGRGGGSIERKQMHASLDAFLYIQLLEGIS